MGGVIVAKLHSTVNIQYVMYQDSCIWYIVGSFESSASYSCLWPLELIIGLRSIFF